MDMMTLERLAQLPAGRTLTVDLFDNQAKATADVSFKVTQEWELANALFRSRVVQTIADELRLSDENAFLKELCARLGVGTSVAHSPIRMEMLETITPLSCKALREILEETKAYVAERTALLTYVDRTALWCNDEALHRMIENADRAMLRMIRRDYVVAEQQEQLKPHQQFVDSVLAKQPHVTQKVSHLMSIIKSMPEVKGYDRAVVREIVERHEAALYKRAVALLARDEPMAPSIYLKRAKCIVEALDGIVREIELGKSEPTPEVELRKSLLKEVSIREKMLHPSEFPEKLAEVMRQQIVTGDTDILECYQHSWKEGRCVTVPYPLGQGEQRVLSTAKQEARICEHLRKDYENTFGKAMQLEKLGDSDLSPSAAIQQAARSEGAMEIFKKAICTQYVDITRETELWLGDKRIPSNVTQEELYVHWATFMDTEHHPDRFHLMQVAATLSHQGGIMTMVLEPILHHEGALGFFIKPNRNAADEMEEFRLTHVNDSVTIDITYTLKQPAHALVFLGTGTVSVQLDPNDPTAYVRQNLRVKVTQKNDAIAFSIDKPMETTYRLGDHKGMKNVSTP